MNSNIDNKSEVNYSLTSLSFQITDKCNLKCSFCSRDAKCNSYKMMNPQLIDKSIEEALKFAPLKIVNISGGEPFLHDNLEEILDIIANKYKLEIRINTNGILLNDTNLQMLKNYNVKKFTISLDSHIAEKHDYIRGVQGSFRKTIEGIEKINSMNGKFFIKMTVNENNVSDLFETMLLAEKLGATGFSFSRTIPIGRAKNLSDKNNLEFVNEYFKQGLQCSKYAKKTNMKFIIDDPMRHKFDIRAIDYLKYNKDKLNKIWGGCTAGLSYLYILLNGDVIACTALTKPVGNIFKDNIKDIWFNSDLLYKLRNRNFLTGKCSDCEKKYLCGGCRAYALATTGNEMGPDQFCSCNN